MDTTLQEVLKEQMQESGITLVKLGQQTGIAERYLTAFISGDATKLPAAPYVRGYLFKIAEVLDLNGNDLWEQYTRESGNIKSSGARDIMPSNRYELKKINKLWAITAGILLIVLIYGALNFDRFLGNPRLDITNPRPETLVTSSHEILLSGVIAPEDSLFIDGEAVTVGPTGMFEHVYALDPGLNQIEFTAKKLLGKEHTISKQVIYQPDTQPIPSF